MLHAEKLIDASCLDLDETQLAQVIELMARYAMDARMDDSINEEMLEIMANVT